MNIRKAFYFTIAMIPLILCGCMQPGGQMPEPEATDFWSYIQNENPYEKWNQWPGMKGMYEGQSPHGEYLKLYLNEKAYQAATTGGEMPDGAILVKENYNKEKELVAITPMYRTQGYNPDAGDWFWTKYGDNGKVMASGKVQSCIDCHAKVKNQDWLFTKNQ